MDTHPPFQQSIGMELPMRPNPSQSELSEVCAVEPNAVPEGMPRPRHAGRHRADSQPHATRHEWNASPKVFAEQARGACPGGAYPPDQGDRAGLWPPAGSRACPLRRPGG